MENVENQHSLNYVAQYSREVLFLQIIESIQLLNVGSIEGHRMQFKQLWGVIRIRVQPFTQKLITTMLRALNWLDHSALKAFNKLSYRSCYSLTNLLHLNTTIQSAQLGNSWLALQVLNLQSWIQIMQILYQ